MTLSFRELVGDPPEFEPDWRPRVRTPRCDVCGRFCAKLYPVWSKGWPVQEILFEVGDCCKELI